MPGKSAQCRARAKDDDRLKQLIQSGPRALSRHLRGSTHPRRAGARSRGAGVPEACRPSDGRARPGRRLPARKTASEEAPRRKCRQLPIWCAASSKPPPRTSSGSPTLPTSPPGKAGSSSPSWSMPVPAASVAGPCVTISKPILVVDALGMATTRRRPGPGLIHHSDRGGQYRSLALGRTLRDSGILASMGSRGDAFDNAACESFMAIHQDRTCEAANLQDERRSQARGLLLHRGLLQPRAQAFSPRLPFSDRIREDVAGESCV